MIAEIAHLLMILAMSLSIGFALTLRKNLSVIYLQKVTTLLLVMITASLAMLFYLFLSDDFSVRYVFEHSSIALPPSFKIASLWGGHEGSLVLWLWIYSAWTYWATHTKLFSDAIKQKFGITLLWILIAFLLFCLLTSNPYLRLLPSAPANGKDLNPLLEDTGMLIHPPILYLGYVGSLIVYPVCIHAMSAPLSEWKAGLLFLTRWVWMFLTAGIALGGWWAYHVLGWGGVWFWDPVENVSLMPWLLNLYLIHTIRIAKDNQVLSTWVSWVGIATGISAVLGLFLVRSGVLVSVHTFSEDPSRGLFLIAVVAMMILYAIIKSPKRNFVFEKHSFLSRSGLLLIGSSCIFVSFIIVILGTLYPVLIQSLGLGMVSVGAPYFNQLMVPLTLIIIMLMVVQSHQSWQKNQWLNLRFLIVKSIIALVITALIWKFMNYEMNITFMIAVFLSSLLILEMNGYSMSKLQRWSHASFGVVVMSLTLSLGFSQFYDVAMVPNEIVDFAGYQLRMLENKNIQEERYQTTIIPIQLLYHNKMVTILNPKKKYHEQTEAILSPIDVYSSWLGDLYLAVGQPSDNNGWVVRCYYKPFQSFLWLGALMMVITMGLHLIFGFFKRKR